MYKFGNKSNKVLDTVNKYLVLAAKGAIMESMIDMSIPKSGGLRTATDQYKLYKKGVSKLDGIIKKSRHQLKDSEGKCKALDLCAYVNGKQSWNRERVVYIMTLFIKSFETLKKAGKIPHDLYIHWGGYWKPDHDNGNSMGWDVFHLEIQSVPQTNIFV